jgi:hypothetical protein
MDTQFLTQQNNDKCLYKHSDAHKKSLLEEIIQQVMEKILDKVNQKV